MFDLANDAGTKYINKNNLHVNAQKKLIQGMRLEVARLRLFSRLKKIRNAWNEAGGCKAGAREAQIKRSAWNEAGGCKAACMMLYRCCIFCEFTMKKCRNEAI